MTVAEAHICGTPVIVQRAPGFITQVVDGKNGYLVDFEEADIRETVQRCIETAPSKALIDDTLAQRWDGGKFFLFPFILVFFKKY